MSLREKLANALRRLATTLHPESAREGEEPEEYEGPEWDPCEKCGTRDGWGGCGECGAYSCAWGCRSPMETLYRHTVATREDGRCAECGAHPYEWTWYGGPILAPKGGGPLAEAPATTS